MLNLDDIEVIIVVDDKIEKFPAIVQKINEDGTYEVKLRKGVAPVLQRYGNTLDLRIRAITSNGGEWNGFISYISGISDPTLQIKTYLKLMPKVKGMVE